MENDLSTCVIVLKILQEGVVEVLLTPEKETGSNLESDCPYNQGTAVYIPHNSILHP